VYLNRRKNKLRHRLNILIIKNYPKSVTQPYTSSAKSDKIKKSGDSARQEVEQNIESEQSKAPKRKLRNPIHRVIMPRKNRYKAVFNV